MKRQQQSTDGKVKSAHTQKLTVSENCECVKQNVILITSLTDVNINTFNCFPINTYDRSCSYTVAY